MATSDDEAAGFVPVANFEIDAVRPQAGGFLLEASGEDGSDYRIEMHIDMPIDRRTRSVLGELLSQTEMRMWRRPRQPLKSTVRRVPRSEAPAEPARDDIV